MAKKRRAPTGKILLIEDEPFAADWIRRIVDNEFRGGIEVIHVDCEGEFVSRFQELTAVKWVAAIIDGILPWDSGLVSRPDTLQPRGEINEAGIRILNDFAADGRLSLVPVLFYSLLDPDRIDLPISRLNMKHMNKSMPDRALIAWLRQSAAQL